MIGECSLCKNVLEIKIVTKKILLCTIPNWKLIENGIYEILKENEVLKVFSLNLIELAKHEIMTETFS